MKRLLLFCALALLPLAVEAQRDATAQTPSGSISGVVIQADTKAPEPRVRVELTDTVQSDTARNRITYTDDKGRFSFAGLPAASFTLRAFAPGFLPADFNQRKPGGSGTTIRLIAGQHLDDATMRLLRGGVLAGLVTDPSGRPMPNVAAKAFALAWTFDGRQFLKLAATATTDDRGQYRLHGLLPGEYVVGVDAPASSPESRTALTQMEADHGFTITFFPGTTSARNASALRVDAGTTHDGLNVPLAWVPLRNLRGKALGFSGKTRGFVRQTGDLMDELIAQRSFDLSPDGSFLVDRLPPGSYRIAIREDGEVGGQWGSATTMLSPDDDASVVITAEPGVQISAQVEYVGGPASLAVPRVSLVAVGDTSVDFGLAYRATSLPNNRMLFSGLPPGLYQLGPDWVGDGSDWYLAGAVIGGTDILKGPLDTRATGGKVMELAMRRPVTTLTGAIRRADGAAVTEYTLVLFPALPSERSQTRGIFTAQPDSAGEFSIKGIRSGDYLLAATDDVAEYQWTDQKFLEALAATAMKLHVTEGQQLRQDITIK